jgi:hypothetical protein
MSKEQTYTIKWILPEKDGSLVRFKEITDTLALSDIVAKLDFEKLGLVKDATVLVKIDDDDDGDKIVSYIKVSEDKKEEKKAEPETKKESNTVTESLVVQGISDTGVVFKEKEDVWHDLPEGISKSSLLKDNIVSGSKVEVVIGEPKTSKKGANKTIVSIKLLEVKKEEKKASNGYGKQNSTGNSIEAQCSVKLAFNILAIELERGDLKNEDVESLVNDFSRLAFDTIQELKNK